MPGSVVDFQGGVTFTCGGELIVGDSVLVAGESSDSLVNNGNLVRTGNADGVSVLALPFTNNRAVKVLDGTLQLTGGLTNNGGTWNIALEASLVMAGCDMNYTFSPAANGSTASPITQALLPSNAPQGQVAGVVIVAQGTDLLPTILRVAR